MPRQVPDNQPSASSFRGSAEKEAHTGTDSRPVVLITGASSGIGRATAHAYARRGALIAEPGRGGGLAGPVHLVLAARAMQSLTDVQRECLAYGSTAMVVATDVSDQDSVQALFDAAVARYGRVEAVVHSCAVVAYGRFPDVPPAVFDQVLATTLNGTANVARAALRLFESQGAGRLVIVGSLLGKIATPLMSAYVTAKWGVHGLVRVLQIEARQTPGIEVSLVWPGSVDTPTYQQSATYVGRMGRPPPPIVSPEKVARTIVRAVEEPRRESSVGCANLVMLAGFRFFPGVFDRLVGPLMRVAGLTGPRVAATPGNVFEPNPSGDALYGNWKRRS